MISFLSVALLEGKGLLFHFSLRAVIQKVQEFYQFWYQVCCPDSNRQEVHNCWIQGTLHKHFLAGRPRAVYMNSLRLGWRIEVMVWDLGPSILGHSWNWNSVHNSELSKPGPFSSITICGRWNHKCPHWLWYRRISLTCLPWRWQKYGTFGDWKIERHLQVSSFQASVSSHLYLPGVQLSAIRRLGQ